MLGIKIKKLNGMIQLKLFKPHIVKPDLAKVENFQTTDWLLQ